MRVRAEHVHGGIVGENCAEQRERNADAADDDVFPAGLERSLLIVKRDEQHGRERGAFDGDPHNAEIIGQRHEQHDGNEQRREHIVTTQLCFRNFIGARVGAEIADGINRTSQCNKCCEANDERAQSVGAKKTVERRNCALFQNVRADFQRQRHERDEGEQVQSLPRLA